MKFVIVHNTCACLAQTPPDRDRLCQECTHTVSMSNFPLAALLLLYTTSTVMQYKLCTGMSPLMPCKAALRPEQMRLEQMTKTAWSNRMTCVHMFGAGCALFCSLSVVSSVQIFTLCIHTASSKPAGISYDSCILSPCTLQFSIQRQAQLHWWCTPHANRRSWSVAFCSCMWYMTPVVCVCIVQSSMLLNQLPNTERQAPSVFIVQTSL